jgi:hypothetical protein
MIFFYQNFESVTRTPLVQPPSTNVDHVLVFDFQKDNTSEDCLALFDDFIVRNAQFSMYCLISFSYSSFLNAGAKTRCIPVKLRFEVGNTYIKQVFPFVLPKNP